MPFMAAETHNFAGRLIALIESGAEQLTQSTLEKLQSNPRTRSYRRLSSADLYGRVYDVYHDLGRWLLEKTDGAVRSRYNDLGQQRFKEHIPLDEVLWAMVLTKKQLRNYLAAWAPADSAVELYRQRELDYLIGQFFDRAMCYTTEGYEQMRGGSGSEPLEREELSSPVARDRHTSGGWVL
jgi:hypothetical protein